MKGIRGSGKSTLLKIIIDELSQTVGRNHIIYIDTENSNPKDLDEYFSSRIKDNNKYYFFIDEAANLGSALNSVLRYREETGASVFLSSSCKLTLPVKDYIEFLILPFSYSEYIEAKPDGNLEDYIKWGGFPGRFELGDEKNNALFVDGLYKSITYKDIFKRKSSVEEYKFNSVAALILGNSGKDFKANFIKDFCNFNKTIDRRILERKTIYNYLDKMENAFLISRTKRYNTADGSFLSTVEKHWVTDNALRTIKKNYINSGDEFFLKNIVYNELIYRGYEVYTGKTYKGEIDFVVFDSGRKCFIQVVSRMKEATTIQQVFYSFSPIRDASPRYVISLDRFDFSHSGITHINIEDFLLQKKVLAFF